MVRFKFRLIDVAAIVVLILLLLFLFFMYRNYNAKIDALYTEKVELNKDFHFIDSMNGCHIAEIQMQHIEISDLKKNNKSLHNEIKLLKIKPKTVEKIIKLETVTHDTFTAAADSFYYTDSTKNIASYKYQDPFLDFKAEVGHENLKVQYSVRDSIFLAVFKKNKFITGVRATSYNPNTTITGLTAVDIGSKPKFFQRRGVVFLSGVAVGSAATSLLYYGVNRAIK